MDDYVSVIGKPVPQAKAEIEKTGFSMRIVKKDGKAIAYDANYTGTVINVEVEKGIVVAILARG